jgi:hypothetical protein
MSTVQEIEAAISKLSREDLAKIRAWLNQFEEPHQGGSPSASPSLLEQARDFPPSVIHPPELKTPEERVAAFQQWVESHADVTVIADDSRDSIYD